MCFDARSREAEKQLHKHVLLLLKLYVLEDKFNRLAAHVAELKTLKGQGRVYTSAGKQALRLQNPRPRLGSTLCFCRSCW